jgi:mRNA-degrading endonuclease toxin of MazEF toxin-antitoxin module
MKRGDLIPVVLAGAYGKPRPALVIQSDLFQKHPSVTVLPVTSELRPIETFRIAAEPSKKNGLRAFADYGGQGSHDSARKGRRTLRRTGAADYDGG